MRRLGWWSMVLLGLTACGSDDDRQRLQASGDVLTDAGPLAHQRLSRYELTFYVTPEAIPIQRAFVQDTDVDTPGIITDQAGHFEIYAANLELSYDWEQDEYVCYDVCDVWQTVCWEVTEEVCDVCYYDECWDECWDDCYTECWDEVVCETFYDEYGSYEECWTETVCEDVCSTSCETVCGTVEEPCNCGFVTYEVCEDECQLWSEQCEWVTRVYTSYPDLSEVVATEASVWLQGESEPLSGQPRQAERALDCSQSPCKPLNTWLQDDRFVVP